MDVVIYIAVLFVIGWVVSKSRILTGILNVIGTALNIFVGVAFIALAVWGLVDGDMEWWLILGSIGIGVYFLWPTRSRRDRRAEVAAALPASRVRCPGCNTEWKLTPEESAASTADCPKCGAAMSIADVTQATAPSGAVSKRCPGCDTVWKLMEAEAGSDQLTCAKCGALLSAEQHG